MHHDTSTLLEPVNLRDVTPSRETFVSPAGKVSSTSEPPDWLDRGQIPGLDGLRAIAVLLVLTVHSMQTPGFFASPFIRHHAHHGDIGVDIFFVISGFLITTLLMREQERHGRVDLKRFYLRRTVRILPAYVAFLLAMSICQYFGVYEIKARDWIGALTYTTNFLYPPSWELGHTWSLSVEEHFYLIWPITLFVAGATGGWRMTFACLTGCCLLRCFIALALPKLVTPADALYYADLAENCTITRLDTISFGCLLALASRSDYWRGWLDRVTRPPLLVLYLVTIFVALEVGAIAKFHLCVFYSLTGTCIALLIWGAIRSEGPLRRVLSNPILTSIGVGSYSIYLWQQMFLHPRQPGWIHQFPYSLPFVFGAATLSYLLIEKPINKLKNRLAP